MKTKSFYDLIKTRLSEEKLEEIDRQAQLEVDILKSIQKGYKGYHADITYDDEARLFHGEVIGLKDVITFQGTNVSELEQAFKDSVDDYLVWCEERGEEPEKTFSGNLLLRIDPKLHAKLAREAAHHSTSLNSFIIEKLEK